MVLEKQEYIVHILQSEDKISSLFLELCFVFQEDVLESFSHLSLPDLVSICFLQYLDLICLVGQFLILQQRREVV